jgi:hypothetical protein
LRAGERYSEGDKIKLKRLLPAVMIMSHTSGTDLPVRDLLSGYENLISV